MQLKLCLNPLALPFYPAKTKYTLDVKKITENVVTKKYASEQNGTQQENKETKKSMKYK